MATIADVARLAGVGVGTVSRVINSSEQVSDATRAKVLAAIEELDYRPSPLARRLSLGRTNRVAVVVPFLTTTSMYERFIGIIETFRGGEYDPVLHHVETVGQRDAAFDSLAHPEHAAGVIAVSVWPGSEQVARFAAAGVPLVLVDARVDGVPCVGINDVAGGKLATRHLIDLGHERIAFVGEVEDLSGVARPDLPAWYRGEDRISASAERHMGYEEALAESWREARPEYTRLRPYGRVEAGRQARELLGLADPPTAVVAASDIQALGVIETARETGVRVPEDLSVVGFDDLELARYVGLTTVRQPLTETGRRAAEVLIEQLAGDGPAPGPIELPLEMVVRSTTGPPPLR